MHIMFCVHHLKYELWQTRVIHDTLQDNLPVQCLIYRLATARQWVVCTFEGIQQLRKYNNRDKFITAVQSLQKLRTKWHYMQLHLKVFSRMTSVHDTRKTRISVKKGPQEDIGSIMDTPFWAVILLPLRSPATPLCKTLLLHLFSGKIKLKMSMDVLISWRLLWFIKETHLSIFRICSYLPPFSASEKSSEILSYSLNLVLAFWS